VLAVVDLDVRVAGRRPRHDVGVAVAGDVAGRHIDADVEIQAVGKPLGHDASAVGIEGAGGKILPPIDLDVRIADGGAGDDVGVAIVLDVADGHIGADVELQGIGEPLGHQARVGSGGVEGAGGQGLAVVDLDVRVADGGPDHQVVIAVAGDVADRHADGT